MAGPARIDGKLLSFTIGSTEYKCDATSVELDSEDADGGLTTFCDAASGGKLTYFFTVKAVWSTDSTSLWSYIWDHNGQTVPFVLKPFGNTVPSASQPHFTGSVIVGKKPGFSLTPGEESEFEYRFDLVDVPAKVISGS